MTADKRVVVAVSALLVVASLCFNLYISWLFERVSTQQLVRGAIEFALVAALVSGWRPARLITVGLGMLAGLYGISAAALFVSPSAPGIRVAFVSYGLACLTVAILLAFLPSAKRYFGAGAA